MKQLRTVLETEYSVDDIFDGRLHFFERMGISEGIKKDAEAKSVKVKEAHGFASLPFFVNDQNTATSLYYREVPLPW